MDGSPTPPRLAAGPLGAWRRELRAGLHDGTTAHVPCGDCTACCTSSQFVHIAPDELDTLAHIPRELLFPAPFAPRGHRVLGFDAAGRCPMLGDHGCTIYDHRPRTCRVYDCRLFAATGVAPDPDKPAIAARVARWRFALDTDDDRDARVALDAAAAAVAADRDALMGTDAGSTATAVAIVEISELFVDDSTPSTAAAREALVALRTRSGRTR